MKSVLRIRGCCWLIDATQNGLDNDRSNRILFEGMGLRLLRLFLGFSAFAWGVSILGVFLSWDSASHALHGLGANPIEYDRMLDYWLRMASGAFALVGAWYFVLMLRPLKYANVIPWFGWLMILEGMILLGHGLRLSLPPFPFYGDTSACFFAGIGILSFSKYAKPTI